METATETIANVAAKICDKYCRFPAEYAEKYGDVDEASTVCVTRSVRTARLTS